MTLPRNTVTGALQKRLQRRSRKRHHVAALLWVAVAPGGALESLYENITTICYIK